MDCVVIQANLLKITVKSHFNNELKHPKDGLVGHLV